jgi:hypothetical protein
MNLSEQAVYLGTTRYFRTVWNTRRRNSDGARLGTVRFKGLAQITLEVLKEQVRRAGFTPSAGCWEDEQVIFAFSVESHGPATYGAAKFALMYRKEEKTLTRDNSPFPLIGEVA